MGQFSAPLVMEEKRTPYQKRLWYWLWLRKGTAYKQSWIIHEGFSYTANNGDKVEVEAGYETDLASIPQIFWSLGLAKSGIYDQPAVLHDHMYGNHQFKRKRCDEIFKEAMEDVHTPNWQSDLIYAGVRAGGWAFY